MVILCGDGFVLAGGVLWMLKNLRYVTVAGLLFPVYTSMCWSDFVINLGTVGKNLKIVDKALDVRYD